MGNKEKRRKVMNKNWVRHPSPKESELVDEADMYHIWILEDDFKIPFTLKE